MDDEKTLTGLIERIRKFGETWYIQEIYDYEGNLKAVHLYNCFGEFETEQPDQVALDDWFLDNKATTNIFLSVVVA